ncbi:MAG: response regulator transcription factor [Saprospiraceae bacterium]
MQQFNCIIVEDEPLAAEVLQDYVQKVPYLNLKATCGDAILALEILKEHKIDLIFLDIHLPKLKGLDFVKSLKNPPQIIITTAYHEYALKGYELNVLDYLLKPIEFSRFIAAVNKLNDRNSPSTEAAENENRSERESIFFNVSKKKTRIYLDEILYVESLKEYVQVVTRNKSIVTKFQLGQIEELLSKNNFLRIHRSYIVAKDKIDSYTATEIEINQKLIPIGRSYKEFVQTAIEKL